MQKLKHGFLDVGVPFRMRKMMSAANYFNTNNGGARDICLYIVCMCGLGFNSIEGLIHIIQVFIECN